MIFSITVDPFVGPTHISHHVLLIIYLDCFQQPAGCRDDIAQLLFCCLATGTIGKQNITCISTFDQFTKGFQGNELIIFILFERFKRKWNDPEIGHESDLIWIKDSK